MPELGYCEMMPRDTEDYLILTLNSCRVEARERGGTGYVGYSQVASLLERAVALAGRANRNFCGIAALHHHLLPIEAIRLKAFLPATAQSRFSFVTDGIDVLQALICCGFSLALHGHLHMPFHYMYSEPNGSEMNPLSLVVSCAGSFGIGVQSGNISSPHQFQAIEITPYFIRFHSFEAPLREYGRPRNWSRRILQFPRPETINRNSKHPLYLWQIPEKRLKLREVQERIDASLAEFELFESCLQLEALRKNDVEAIGLLKEAVKQREDQLSDRVRDNFDAAFTAALSIIATNESRKEFYESFDKDDPWTLVERMIRLMNEWKG